MLSLTYENNNLIKFLRGERESNSHVVLTNGEIILSIKNEK